MRSKKFSIAEGAVVLLVVTLLASLFALYHQQKQTKLRVLESTLDSARLLSNFAHEAHLQYSASVGQAIQATNITLAVELSPNAGSIHFPASFSRKLTQRFTKNHPNARFSIYSDDPFSSSKDRTLDNFALRALAVLQAENAPAEFWETENFSKGSPRVRYATPIVMQQGCTACHNSEQWGLEKRDWKVGDIRGVREVVLQMPGVAETSNDRYATLLGLISISCALGVFLIFPTVRREATQRESLDALNDKLIQRSIGMRTQQAPDLTTEVNSKQNFNEVLDAYVVEFAKHGKPVGLAFFSLDQFAAIRDRHGLEVTNRVITEFARVLKAHVRQEDFVARIADDEFALIIPNMTEEALIMRARQIEDTISRIDVKADTMTVNMTASAGVVSLEPGENSASLTHRGIKKLRENRHANNA